MPDLFFCRFMYFNFKFVVFVQSTQRFPGCEAILPAVLAGGTPALQGWAERLLINYFHI